MAKEKTNSRKDAKAQSWLQLGIVAIDVAGFVFVLVRDGLRGLP